MELEAIRDKFLQGHVLHVLRTLPDGCVQCCVTSPPYWGLRVYSGEQEQIWLNGDKPCEEHVWGDFQTGRVTGGQDRPPDNKNPRAGSPDSQTVRAFCVVCGAWRGGLGLEPTIELYVQHIIEIFREVRRVLRDDGVLWLNLGDSYMGGKGRSSQAWSTEHQDRDTLQKAQHQICGKGETRPADLPQDGLKPKDLCGIPWRVALALQADGWWLRSDIIWSKRNPMPESVTDRPTRSHEYVFLLSKSKHYFYDAEAVREPIAASTEMRVALAESRKGENEIKAPVPERYKRCEAARVSVDKYTDARDHLVCAPGSVSGRNLRSVWHLATQPFSEAHFATFPEKLVEKCILAGSKPGSLVLDPFMGSGTVAVVAARYGRSFVGIDLAYQEMARERLAQVETQLQLTEAT